MAKSESFRVRWLVIVVFASNIIACVSCAAVRRLFFDTEVYCYGAQ